MQAHRVAVALHEPPVRLGKGLNPRQQHRAEALDALVMVGGHPDLRPDDGKHVVGPVPQLGEEEPLAALALLDPAQELARLELPPAKLDLVVEDELQHGRAHGALKDDRRCRRRVRKQLAADARRMAGIADHEDQRHGRPARRVRQCRLHGRERQRCRPLLRDDRAERLARQGRGEIFPAPADPRRQAARLDRLGERCGVPGQRRVDQDRFLRPRHGLL